MKTMLKDILKLKRVRSIDKNKRKLQEIDDDLKKELEDIKKKLMYAYSCLNMESDDDMIESYIYEILAREKHYNYVLKKMKFVKGA